jgi:hypothetical protein
MIVILKRENIWDLIKFEVTSTNFPTIVGRKSLIEKKKPLKKRSREHI